MSGHSEDHSLSTSPVQNQADLTATQSDLNNVVQINGSPGAVVNQVAQSSSSFPAILGAAVATAFLLLNSKVTISVKITPLAGQIVGGVLVAGILWKSFEWLDSILTNETRSEIAVWLVGIDPVKPIKALQEMMANTLNLVFGKKQLSLHCATAALIIATGLSSLAAPSQSSRCNPFVVTTCPSPAKTALALSLVLFIAVFWFIRCLRNGAQKIIRSDSFVDIGKLYLQTCLQSLLSLIIENVMATFVAQLLGYPNPRWTQYGAEELTTTAWVLSAIFILFFIPTVLLLFLASALAVNVAVRFNLGFRRFNRTFDIKRKPLQCIGIVASLLGALAYWTLGSAMHFLT